MRRTLLTLFATFVGITGASGQSGQIYFDRANELYQSGQYQEAIGIYQQIIGDGIVSGEVYFNLGNAYYKTGQIGYAILYYEKAKIYLEDDEALDQNLRIARIRTVDEIEPIPRLFMVEWWNALLHALSLDAWAWSLYGLFLLIIVLVILNLLRHGRWRKILWITVWVFIPVAIIFLARVYQFETSQFGIILEPKVSVMSEPNLSGQEVFILHEGTKVRINRSVTDWNEITIPDGKTGWVKQQNLEII